MTQPIAQKIPLAFSPSAKGMLFGFLGVLCFSLTLPATRLAVASFDPMIVGLGRAAVAACFAAVLLRVRRQAVPSRPQLYRLAIVAAGVVVGFPTLSSWAMHRVGAAHGAVVLGLLPIGTAIAGFLRTGERPSPLFWLASGTGSAAVILFALNSGAGNFQLADLALLGAVILCSIGYAEGARLAREMGGWQVICWALLLAFPVIITPLALTIRHYGLSGTASSWAGMFYLSAFSSFLGFFAWYHGLAMGGIARVSQYQLLQPFFTLSFAALFLGEKISPLAMLCAGLVSASIVITRKCKIGHSAESKLAAPSSRR